MTENRGPILSTFDTSAIDAMEYAASPTANVQKTIPATTSTASLLEVLGEGRYTERKSPQAFVVQTAGVVHLSNGDDATADGHRYFTAVAGVIYPIQGINGKAITTIHGVSTTTADNITFFYNRR